MKLIKLPFIRVVDPGGDHPDMISEKKDPDWIRLSKKKKSFGSDLLKTLFCISPKNQFSKVYIFKIRFGSATQPFIG